MYVHVLITDFLIIILRISKPRTRTGLNKKPVPSVNTIKIYFFVCKLIIFLFSLLFLDW